MPRITFSSLDLHGSPLRIIASDSDAEFSFTSDGVGGTYGNTFDGDNTTINGAFHFQADGTFFSLGLATNQLDIGATAVISSFAANLKVNTGTAIVNRGLSATTPATLSFFKMRTSGSLSNGDQIGFMDFYGRFSGTDYLAARIGATSDAAPGASDMPAKIEFMTSPDGSSTPVTRYAITNGGRHLFGQPTDDGTSLVQANGVVKTTSNFWSMQASSTLIPFMSQSNVDGTSVGFYSYLIKASPRLGINVNGTEAVVISSSGVQFTTSGNVQNGASFTFAAGSVNTVNAPLSFAATSPANLTASQNNYAPASPFNPILRISANAGLSLTGLVKTYDGQRTTILNVGTNAFTLTHEDAASTAANRFLCPGSTNLSISVNGGADLWYDGTTQRWRVALLGAGTGPAGPTGPSAEQFLLMFAGTASTTQDSTQKLVVGEFYFDPTDTALGTSGTSTATLEVIVQTSAGGNTVHCDLLRETGAGAPTVVATIAPSSGTSATLVTVDVSSAFRPTGTAGIFAPRIWLTTNNGTDYATITNARVRLVP